MKRLVFAVLSGLSIATASAPVARSEVLILRAPHQQEHIRHQRARHEPYRHPLGQERYYRRHGHHSRDRFARHSHRSRRRQGFDRLVELKFGRHHR